MQTALRSRLLNQTDAGARVDWGLRPKTLPAIRLSIVSAPRDYHLGGAQTTQHYRVQVDCYAETYKAAKDLEDDVIALLEPASGEFQASFVIGRRDGLENTELEPVQSRQIDFKITHIPA